MVIGMTLIAISGLMMAFGNSLGKNPLFTGSSIYCDYRHVKIWGNEQRFFHADGIVVYPWRVFIFFTDR